MQRGFSEEAFVPNQSLACGYKESAARPAPIAYNYLIYKNTYFYLPPAPGYKSVPRSISSATLK